MGRKPNTQEFVLEKLIIKYGNNFIMSLSNYKNNKSKITLTCKTCGKNYSIIISNLLSFLKICDCEKNNNSFIRLKVLLENKYNTRFTFYNINYIGTHGLITIRCEKCHNLFTITGENAKVHILCKKCIYMKSYNNFTTKANSLHLNKYDYSLCLEEFLDDSLKKRKKYTIYCKNCKTIFKQTRSIHLSGKGCPNCCNKGFWTRTDFNNICKNNIATFYVLECYNDNEVFLKIGITSKSVKERYNRNVRMPYGFKTLIEFKDSPFLIFNIEKELLKNIKKYHPLIKFSGHSECLPINTYKTIVNKLINYGYKNEKILS